MPIRVGELDMPRTLEVTCMGELSNRDTSAATERTRELAKQTGATRVLVDSSELSASLSPSRLEEIAEDFLFAIEGPMMLVYVPSPTSKKWDFSQTWPVFEHDSYKIKICRSREEAMAWLEAHAPEEPAGDATETATRE